MARRPLTEAEVARLQAQARGAWVPAQRPRRLRRRPPGYTTFPPPVQTLHRGGGLLTYTGWETFET